MSFFALGFLAGFAGAKLLDFWMDWRDSKGLPPDEIDEPFP